jgi:hypothetical protein
MWCNRKSLLSEDYPIQRHENGKNSVKLIVLADTECLGFACLTERNYTLENMEARSE